MTEKRILVVDDNVDFCANIKDIIELEGYEVTVAYDGNMALDMINSNDFGLILTDLVMPGMDGITAIRAIRQRGITIPILVLTAWGEDAVMQSAIDAGANDMINKPIDFKVLFRLINNNYR